MDSAVFNWVDYGIVSIIILSMLISLVRGFVREALSLVTWVGAIWIGIHFYAKVSLWLQPYISASPLRMAAAFFLLFACSLLVGSIISFVLVQFIHKTGLSGTDRSLGLVFGLGRGFVVVAVGLLMISMMFPGGDPIKPSPLEQSHLASRFLPMMNWLKQFLPEAPSPEKIMNLPGLSE